MDMTYLTYEAFGAIGDGVTDDLAAICRTHEAANERALPVRAKSGACYYIGKGATTAQIRTDTDWTDATFIIDDRNVEDRNQSIFRVAPTAEPYPIRLPPFHRGDRRMDVHPETTVYITVTDPEVRHFIRRGINRNNGSPKTDSFLLSPDGTVGNDIIWDFTEPTTGTAYPVDETPLTVRGGTFRRIANLGVWDEESGTHVNRYHYHARNLSIERSNTTVENVKFSVEREGEVGAPYGGDIRVSRCAHVTVKNCVLSAHKLYWTPQNGGMSPMGTYGISVQQAAFVSLIGLTQTVDIMDRSRWGVMGSNFGKDLLLEDCTLSRFDAHQGVTNCTIRRCRLGWQCLNAIGVGCFLIEDSEAFGNSLFNLRVDYGCFWDGTLVIRNCRWTPAYDGGSVIGAKNDGEHDFGYVCSMPSYVEIDGLTIDTERLGEGAHRVSILPEYDAPSAVPSQKPFPYRPTEHLVMRNVTVPTGTALCVTNAPQLYPDLSVERDR